LQALLILIQKAKDKNNTKTRLGGVFEPIRGKGIIAIAVEPAWKWNLTCLL